MSEANEMTSDVDAVVMRLHNQMITSNDGYVTRGTCRVDTPDLMKLLVNAKLRLSEAKIERVARVICSECEDNPDHKGDARGNDYRWQDYIEVAKAAICAMYDFA